MLPQFSQPQLAHSVPETCRALGISRGMFYKLVRAGQIRIIKIGARSLVLESERQRFLAERLAAAQEG